METNDYYSRDLEEQVGIEQKPEYQVFVDLMTAYVDSTEDLNISSYFLDGISSSEDFIGNLYLADETRASIKIAESKSSFLSKYQELSFEEQMELDEYLLTIFPENELFYIKRAEYSH